MAKTITKLPKRTNANNGKKAHNDNIYYKIGRIRMNSWINAHLPAADILISERQLVHISKSHAAELFNLGLTAINYVTLIINQCNHIRKDIITNSYIFVIKAEPIQPNTTLQMAVLEIEERCINQKKVYIIKTAHPENWKRLSKYEFVCDNPRS